MLYIADMMSHLGVEYVVGWISAASKHGAGYQAAQVFQVATSRSLRAKAFGRSKLEFYTRDYAGKLPCSTALLAAIDGSLQ